MVLSAGAEGDVESQGLQGQYPGPDGYMHPGDEDEGWVSWAWSFVPAIVGPEEEGEEGFYPPTEEGGGHGSPQQQTPKDPVVSIGFYCTKACLTFKVLVLDRTACRMS